MFVSPIMATSCAGRASLAWRPAALAERHAVNQQLGFVPWNTMRVAATDIRGSPTAIELYPLTQEMTTRRGSQFRRRAQVQPWPTIFWLTCPRLRSDVSSLEAVGVLPAVRRIVARNGNIARRLRSEHEAYATRRWGMLHDADRALVLNRAWARSLKGTGVGGTHDLLYVKCLHAHYANYLATGRDLVGEAVHLSLEEGMAEEALELQRRMAAMAPEEWQQATLVLRAAAANKLEALHEGSRPGGAVAGSTRSEES